MTTITLTIQIDAASEDVLTYSSNFAGAIAEVREGARTLSAAIERATGSKAVNYSIAYGATDPDDPVAAEMLLRRLPKLGAF